MINAKDNQTGYTYKRNTKQWWWDYNCGGREGMLQLSIIILSIIFGNCNINN